MTIIDEIMAVAFKLREDYSANFYPLIDKPLTSVCTVARTCKKMGLIDIKIGKHKNVKRIWSITDKGRQYAIERGLDKVEINAPRKNQMDAECVRILYNLGRNRPESMRA